MDSFASAAERQASFTAQTSSPPDSFHDPLSRPESFVSASGSSFPARGVSATSGSVTHVPDTVIEMGGPLQAQTQTVGIDNGSLSDVPPSQQQGWR